MDNQLGKKKVLIVATIDRHISSFHLPLIKELSENGFVVDVASNGSENFPYVNRKFDVPFTRNPVSIANIRSFKKLKNIIRMNNYDIIHCHTPVGGAIGRLAANGSHSKVIYTAHGLHFFEGAPLKNWLLFYPIEYLLSKYTDILITINKEDYSLAKRRFHSKKTVYIPGVGVDKKKFKKTDDRKIDRKSLNLNENDFVITYIGELSHRKHQDILINAMHIIANSHKDIKLLLVGEGDKEAEYKKLALGNGQIIFLGYRKDIVNILNITDLVVSPSRQEGLPVNIMESMSLGLPILVSNVRGNRDLVSENAVIYEDNAYSYVDKILEAYENVELRKELSKENKNNFKKYELENINKMIMEVYR